MTPRERFVDTTNLGIVPWQDQLADEMARASVASLLRGPLPAKQKPIVVSVEMIGRPSRTVVVDTPKAWWS